MSQSIRARTKRLEQLVEVKMLIKHPMHTGLVKDSEGQLIPAHFIQNLDASIDGEAIFSAQFNTAVSKDPFLKFSYNGQAGDQIEIRWLDSLGNSDQLTVTVA